MVQSLGILLNVDIDGKVSVDVSHLVFVALCDTSNQVLDDRLDGSEGCDVLSRAMVDFDLNELLAFLALGKGEGNGDVREILGEFACRVRSSAGFIHSQLWHPLQAEIAKVFPTSGALNGDDSGADVDLDTLWNDQLLLREDVLHLEQRYWGIVVKPVDGSWLANSRLGAKFCRIRAKTLSLCVASWQQRPMSTTPRPQRLSLFFSPL